MKKFLIKNSGTKKCKKILEKDNIPINIDSLIDDFIKYKEKAKIWAHYHLGILYYDLKRLKESEIEIRESLRINPDYQDAHFFLGSLLFNIGKEVEAYNEYLFAVKKEPLLAEKLSILALFSESKDEKIKN